MALRLFGAAFVALGLTFASTAVAQFGGSREGGPTVTATGVELIRVKPEKLRMQLDITVKGKNLADALKKLAARRETALAELEKMSADKDSIRAGDARLEQVDPNQQRQMEMMVRQRMQQGGKKAKKAAAEKPVSVVCTLNAEWPLSDKTGEAMLVESQAIEDKVRAADLAGKNVEEKKTPEEQELEEEMQGRAMMYSDDGQAKPGEPSFLFVGKISSERREQALAAAYAKARQEAERLCKAAGRQLGPLAGMSGNVSSEQVNYGMGRRYGYQQQMMAQMLAERQEQEGDSAEAIGVQPGEVILPARVSALFQLAPEK
jgi:uncharacterized protein YggE